MLGDCCWNNVLEVANFIFLCTPSPIHTQIRIHNQKNIISGLLRGRDDGTICHFFKKVLK